MHCIVHIGTFVPLFCWKQRHGADTVVRHLNVLNSGILAFECLGIVFIQSCQIELLLLNACRWAWGGYFVAIDVLNLEQNNFFKTLFSLPSSIMFFCLGS